jgi:hypothetical protein
MFSHGLDMAGDRFLHVPFGFLKPIANSDATREFGDEGSIAVFRWLEYNHEFSRFRHLSNSVTKLHTAGAKAPILSPELAKAEALAYLEAKPQGLKPHFRLPFFRRAKALR